MCPSRMWYRQAWWDSGTDRVGVLGTTGETVGQIEHWNDSMGTLGMSRELVPLTGGETGAICPGPPV